MVRVIRCHGDSNWRRSDWLSTVWPIHNRKQFPFCALHCWMRITEAMFMMITQQYLKNEHVIDKLKAGLEKAGICKKPSKIAGASGVHTYEKLTIEGHQSLKLLAEDSEGQGQAGSDPHTGVIVVTRGCRWRGRSELCSQSGCSVDAVV